MASFRPSAVIVMRNEIVVVGLLQFDGLIISVSVVTISAKTTLDFWLVIPFCGSVTVTGSEVPLARSLADLA